MSSAEDDMDDVSVALQPLQDGFAADGGFLAVDRKDGTLQIRLVLTDESCANCIVGPDVLRAIVKGRLADAGVTAPVDVVDPRE